MSLAVLADHMASKGRNGDTMLVHMAPEEVRGLHALAAAHGGELTINPETGLPEANFLKRLLPTIIGAALAATGVGAPMAALMVGGFEAARTGDLSKGIMAGLGAYGGAGIGSALSSAGTTALAGSEAALAAGRTAAANIPAETLATGVTQGISEESIRQAVANEAARNVASQAPFYSKLGAGLQGLASEQGRTAFMQGIGGGKGLLKAGYMAASPMLAAEATKAKMPQTTTPMGRIQFMRMPGGQEGDYGTLQGYQYTPEEFMRLGGFQGMRERMARGEEIPPPGAASGGLMSHLADGGLPYADDFVQRSEPVVRMAVGGTPPGMTGSVAEQNVLNTKGWQSRSGLTGIEGLNSNINMWFNEFPQAKESDIRSAMQQYGLNDADIMRATGKSVGDLAYKPPTVTPVDPNKPAIISSTTPTGYDYSAAQLQNDRQRQINDIYNRVLNRQAEQSGLDYWTNSGLSMADIESQIKQIAKDIGVAAPKPIVSGTSTPGTQGPSVEFGGDTVIPDYTAPQPQVTLGEAFQPTPQTMEQVRTDYEQGGGSTRMPTITDIKPGERTYTLNAVADMITGFLQQNPNAKYSEVQQFARSNGIPEMQARAAFNEFRFSTMTGGTKQAYDYLMGRAPYSTKPFVPGGGPLSRSYAEVMGLTNSAMGRFRPTMPPSGGTTDRDTTTTTTGGTTKTTGTTTPSVDTLRTSFDQSIFGRTPEEKAAYYNSLLGQGYTDEQIRAAINAPLDDNWLALRAIAERLRAGTTGGGSVTSGGITGGGTNTTGGGITLLGGNGAGSTSTTTNTATGSGTPITDFLFGTQDASTVPVEDRSTYSNAAVDERINDFLNARDRSFYYDYAAPSRSFDDTSPFARGGLSSLAVLGAAKGGRFNLGDYSDGGRLLRGPGDGVSDSIPATIGGKRPARLADGEFVVPARIVSELGNGSTEAGARKLYAMMDRVQSARRKSVGKGKVAKNTRADKYLPA